LSASQAAAVGGKVAQIFIPTPDANQSSIQYDQLYKLTFSQPATYIRFSSTVEDCCGCPYDMNDEDDPFLKSVNEKRNASTQCSEDQLEEVMNLFEETAQAKQPYAAVDNPPVLPYEEMESAIDENLDDSVRAFTKEIYEHWKTRRLEDGNQSLLPSLKFETGADTDDADPYVCFRRREVRQIRKTRGRDAHSAEKLKKLRKELEESRKLMASIRQREILKREQLAVERQLFEQRTNLRQVKLNLPEKYRDGDEDLLINQKVSPAACIPRLLMKLTFRSPRRGNRWIFPHHGLLQINSGSRRDRMDGLPKQTYFPSRSIWQRRRTRCSRSSMLNWLSTRNGTRAGSTGPWRH